MTTKGEAFAGLSVALTTPLKTGEVDYGAITPAFYEEMTKQANVNAVKYDTYSFTFYTYQLDTAKTDLFQEKAVRQAQSQHERLQEPERLRAGDLAALLAGRDTWTVAD